MARRVAAEMFGQYFSLHLDALKRRQKLEAATRARQLLDQFLRKAAQSGAVDELLAGDLVDFAALVPCDGLGFWLQGAWRGQGSVPPQEAIPALARVCGGRRRWTCLGDQPSLGQATGGRGLCRCRLGPARDSSVATPA